MLPDYIQKGDFKVMHNPECAQYARKIMRMTDGILVEEEMI